MHWGVSQEDSLGNPKALICFKGCPLWPQDRGLIPRSRSQMKNIKFIKLMCLRRSDKSEIFYQNDAGLAVTVIIFFSFRYFETKGFIQAYRFKVIRVRDQIDLRGVLSEG